MNYKTNLALAGMLMLTPFVKSQTPAPRELPAKRTSKPVKIDGLLNDEAWKDATLMTDLIEFRPKMGANEDYANRTEAWLMYNDEGIFFGGFCYERTKDSIARELKGRDGYGANDYVGIILDTYNDKLNGFEYFVTPLNEQWDAKVSPAQNDNNNGGEDFTWNSVWKSGVVIHENGWSFEMFIPYSAIRFGKKEVQTWGLNITRRRRKTEQQYTWNPIDINKNGFLTQEGFWTGITNIKPPLRLQFYPYMSFYANHFPLNQPGEKNLTSQLNGGMDVKYGINQAFTLDATLIPDFGQVQSDNQVLNLTPFEVKYNEYRAFFTEGTELFGKGNLFYSRRIGGSPLHQYKVYDIAGPDEKIIVNPSESKLINATKISGRTQHGLGIGVLNAVTKEEFAVIQNARTGAKREIMTDPLTNYNIIVLDQSLKHNSSISLINTNVLRSGPDYDANVTAGLFNFNDKKNTWNVSGKVAVSNLFNYKPDGGTQSGYSHSISLGKTSGRFNFNVWQELADTKYTHNDLGYFTNNNYLDHGAWLGYKWTEPRSWYNRIFVNFNFNYSRLFSKINPVNTTYQRANMNVNTNVQTKKLWWFGSFWNFTPSQNDFYEPRRQGWFFRRGNSLLGDIWYEGNSVKKYSASVELAVRKYFNFYNQLSVDLFTRQTYRFSNRYSLTYQFAYQPRYNNMGYTWQDADEIIFARRKVNTYENIISAKYSFTNKMGITFRARHYLSTVTNHEFFNLLQADGKLIPNNSFNQPVDQNLNIFNIDMVFTWEFAPGSFINIVWKNSVYDFKNTVEEEYFKNFIDTFEADQNNNISFKIIYYLDYLQLKKKRK